MLGRPELYDLDASDEWNGKCFATSDEKYARILPEAEHLLPEYSTTNLRSKQGRMHRKACVHLVDQAARGIEVRMQLFGRRLDSADPIVNSAEITRGHRKFI